MKRGRGAVRRHPAPALAVLLAAAAATPAAPRGDSPDEKDASAPLPAGVLNARYRCDAVPGGGAALSNGVYRAPVAPGAAVRIEVAIDPVHATGDLDGDGRRDTAVVLVVQTGGTGVFRYLALVLDADGRARTTEAVPLGDRVRLRRMSLREGVIEVAMLAHGPDDPMCCPTQPVNRRYRLAGGRLEAAAGEPGGPGAERQPPTP